jgi:hypothetical protein
MRSHRLTRTAALITAAAVAAALLGACGGASSTSVTADSGKAEAAAAAQRVVLTATDLPGYNANPPAAIDASGAKAASSFQSCAGAAAALGDPDRAAASPGFYKAGTTMVASIAVVSPDKAGAEKAMADLSRDDVATCLTTLFKDVLALDQLPGTTARTERLPTSDGGGQSTTWRTTIQVTSAQLAVYSDLTLFQSGRTVAALFNVQTGTPFPSAERQRLLQSMLQRTD